MRLYEDVPKLAPGKKKAIKLELHRLGELKEKIDHLKYTIGSVAVLAPEFKSEVFALVNAVNAKIEKLKKQLAADQTTSHKKFIGFWNQNVETNCSQALKEFRAVKRVLYRGTEVAPHKAFVGRSRLNRMTKDSDPTSQIMFDFALTKLGIKALRSNSIFTSSKISQAESYGDLYVIIPANGFIFSYTSEGDVQIDYPSELVSEKKINVINKLIKKAGRDPDDYDLASDYLESSIRDIKKDFSKDPVLSKLKAEDLVDLAEFKKRYAPTDKNLRKGLKDGVEILINGSYYAFDYNTYHDVLEKVLKFKLSDY